MDQDFIINKLNKDLSREGKWLNITVVTVPQHIPRVLLTTIAKLNAQGIKNLKVYPAFPSNIDWDREIIGNQNTITTTRSQNVYDEIIRIPEYQLNRQPKDNATWEDYDNYMVKRDGAGILTKLDETYEKLYKSDTEFKRNADIMIQPIKNLKPKDLNTIKNYIKNSLFR